MSDADRDAASASPPLVEETSADEAIPAPALPAGLAEILAGYRWARDTVGQSNGAVYRLSGRSGAPDLFVKHGTGHTADDVTDEMTRLLWLSGRVTVPDVTAFVRASEQAWLVTTALPGETAHARLVATEEAREAVVDALASLLRQIHALPVDECPFSAGLAIKLKLARARIDGGLVDTDDFDRERQGWSAEDVWHALQTTGTPFEDLVVTHGDLSLDNVLIHSGAVTGCIDVGRLGVADRYQDLAILWNNLGEFGPGLQERFLREYGLPAPDKQTLQFYVLLDELF